MKKNHESFIIASLIILGTFGMTAMLMFFTPEGTDKVEGAIIFSVGQAWALSAIAVRNYCGRSDRGHES